MSQPPDETPEQDPRVRALLAAAAAPTEPGPLPGEQEALAAFREAHSRRRFSMPSSLSPVRAAVAAGLGAGVLLAAGVGGAAAGVLPGAAQDTARTWLDTVGVEVPGPNAHSAGHADQRGRSAEAGTPEEDATTETDVTETEAEETTEPAGTAESTEKELPEASEHGQTVSETARSTEAEGADKGAEISGLASEGRSTERRAHAGSGDEADDADETTTDEDTDAETSDEADGTEDSDDAAAGAQGGATADAASGGRAQGGERRP
ncbi:hypothetical protein [Nocardioides iriomotensis]|uniref:Uncharacterized protein n=1 Tax=Nocardioides iriomotensis TaxID=715784 RepID=A0A4Q5J6J4_9ACTN|nr:hypothetical protein [Nocardioides iriomotensis]RYU13369.1 hypothetical protein ETU37_05890 [Nocardioides iriomotensis]